MIAGTPPFNVESGITWAGGEGPRAPGSNRVTFGEPNNESRTFGFAVEIGPRRRVLLGPLRIRAREHSLGLQRAR
jgi:hypothetical protein